MKKMLKRLCTGFLALATVVTALPTTPVHAESKQYWTESKERVGIVEKVMNDGSIGSTFNEGHLTVEGEDAYCIDINTDFRNGYKTRADASTRMSADQISDVALSIEYVKQYTDSHSGISKNHAYLLRQLVVWQRLSVHLGWQCDNVRASYDEIPKATQDEVFSGAKAFVKENKGRYECGGYIYSGEGQELGQFWAKLNVGNTKLQKVSSNTSITDGNGNYSIAGATYGVFSDKDCTKQLATLTTDENGNTDVVEVKAGTVYIKELSAPAGYKVDTNIYSLKVEAGKTATLNVSDTPKVTDTLIELFKIDMETQKDNPQGNASLAGAEFTWKYYTGFYNKDNLPAEATRTWVTKTIAETDSDGTIHYVTKLADTYKVSGDSFYMQDGKAVLPLGTLTVEETKAPNGYLLDGAYMQAGDKSEQIKGLYVTQITEDGDLAVLTGSNQFSVSDKVIRGGVKIQKRDLETGDTKPQGSATLKDTAFDIISLNDNAVLVEGKLYKKNEVVKTIHTDIEGVASTSADLLPYGKFRIVESEAPNGYLTDGAKPIDFAITENGKIVDLTDEAHSIYNQIKRGDIEGVKIGAGTHKRLADVPFRITSKTTGESHVVVTDDNGQFSTSSDWASHKHNTNAGKTSEDGVWFGTSKPDDSKGALPYDTYIIEEMRCDSNKGFELIPPFEIVVSRNNLVIDLGTLTDEYEKEISKHLFSTLIKCKECGWSFRRTVRTYKNTYVRWVCSGRNGRGADSCPNKTVVDEEELIEVLQEYFTNVLKQKKKVITHVVNEFQRVYKAKDENVEYEKELNAELAKLQKTRQKYMDMYTDDLISREELNEKIGGSRQEMERIENELKMVSYHLTKGEQLENILNNTFKEIEDITDVHQMTNQQLKRLIQKIEVDKDGNVDIYLRLLGDLGLDESVLIEENETVLNCNDQT